MESGTFDFPDARSSLASPLAKRLFGVDGVAHVFFGGDYITVTKADDVEWGVLKPAVYAVIMDHYGSGQPLFVDRDAHGSRRGCTLATVLSLSFLTPIRCTRATQ